MVFDHLTRTKNILSKEAILLQKYFSFHCLQISNNILSAITIVSADALTIPWIPWDAADDTEYNQKTKQF